MGFLYRDLPVPSGYVTSGRPVVPEGAEAVFCWRELDLGPSQRDLTSPKLGTSLVCGPLALLLLHCYEDEEDPALREETARVRRP